jgi:putative ABC transport system substrate-binding protein
LGWTDGRTVLMDVRWAASNIDQMRAFAKELIDLHPDVIFAYTTAATAVLQRETRTIPIVFVVSDPVGDGFVASLPRPGGNITGFVSQEAAMAGKWLELLTEIAPTVRRPPSCSIPTRLPAADHISYRHSRRPPDYSRWR